MPTSPSIRRLLCVPRSMLQEDLLHDFSKDWSETEIACSSLDIFYVLVWILVEHVLSSSLWLFPLNFITFKMTEDDLARTSTSSLSGLVCSLSVPMDFHGLSSLKLWLTHPLMIVLLEFFHYSDRPGRLRQGNYWVPKPYVSATAKSPTPFSIGHGWSLFNLLQRSIRSSSCCPQCLSQGWTPAEFWLFWCYPYTVFSVFLDSTIVFCPFFHPSCSAFTGWSSIRKFLLSQTGLLIHLYVCLSIRTVLTPEDDAF